MVKGIDILEGVVERFPLKYIKIRKITLWVGQAAPKLAGHALPIPSHILTGLSKIVQAQRAQIFLEALCFLGLG